MLRIDYFVHAGSSLLSVADAQHEVAEWCAEVDCLRIDGGRKDEVCPDGIP